MTPKLADVLTMKEVARYWGKSLSGVRYNVLRNHFRWRYTDTGRILVERDSVIERWGPPTSDIDENDIFD